MTVNQRIFHYRKLAGLTQADVAERMGIKLPTYSKMEREGRITIDKLKKIAEILDVEIDILISDERKEPQKKIEYIPVPIPPINPPDTLGQPSERPLKFPEYIPTAREKATMKTVHYLPKDVQEEIYDFIKQKVAENSK